MIIAAAYFFSAYLNPGSGLDLTPVKSSVYQPLYSIATSSTSYSYQNDSLVQKGGLVQGVSVINVNGSLYTSGGKPIIIYIGGEYCPYCAFQRWPLTMALMRFGNFTNLEYMQSSATDVFGNTATFTYRAASYKSQYLVFQPIEAADRLGNALQTVPSNYTGEWQTANGEAFPYINVADKYVVPEEFYVPTLFANLNWTQIVKLLGSNTELTAQVDQSANALTAMFCKVDGNQPASVCGNGVVGSFETSIVDYRSSLRTTFIAGAPSSTAITWATVQYGQIAWTTKTSMKIR